MMTEHIFNDAAENNETLIQALRQEIETLQNQLILRNDELLKLRERL